MPIYLKQSTASQEIPLGVFVDDVDGKTAETGLTIANTDIKIWKAGGTTLANKNSGGATHISGGIYYAVLDATDTDTVGSLAIFVHVSGALPIRVEAVVLAANIYDSMIGATDKLDVNVEEWNATSVPSEHTAGYPIVTVKDGTGTGEIDTTSGRVTADVTHISGAAVSTSTAQIGVNAVQVGGGTVANGAIPNAVAGASGGLFVAGTNAATTITSAGGSALTLSSTGSNGSGLVVSGNGTGHGIAATGGATGNGMKLLGGATSGAGLDVRSQGGTGGVNYAIYAAGNATGADTGGLYATGGTTGGEGIEAVGTGSAGHGLYLLGAGTGEGFHAQGGASGNGFEARGGGASNHGMSLTRGGAGGDDLNFANNDVTVNNVTTVATVTNGVTLADASSDAVIADAVWNAGTGAYGTGGSYGEKVESLNTGSAVLADSSSDAVIADAVWNALTASYGSANTYGALIESGNVGGGAIVAASVTGNVGGSVASIASGGITAASIATDAIDADAIATDAVNEIADGLLNRDMSVGTDSGSPTVRTVRQALRFLRNKWSLSGTTLTVTKEDDTTASWTATVTTNASADPITASDPASS